jgi:hypothetical protein
MVQTMLEASADLPNVPVAIEQAKTKEGRELLRLGAQAYGPSAIAYSVPPDCRRNACLRFRMDLWRR